MKKVNDILITDRAVKVIEQEIKTDIENMSKQELIDKIKEMKNNYYDEDDDVSMIKVEGNYYCVWVEGELREVCYIDDPKKLGGEEYFYSTEELGIYIISDSYAGEYYCQGDIDDGYCFIDFLGEGEDFRDNVRELVWLDDENAIYKKLEEILSEIDDESEENDFIELCSRGTLESALKEDEYFENAEFEEMGIFAARDIYRIDNRLYYLTDDSWSFNFEEHYYLKEVSSRCYENFNLSKPKSF